MQWVVFEGLSFACLLSVTFGQTRHSPGELNAWLHTKVQWVVFKGLIFAYLLSVTLGQAGHSPGELDAWLHTNVQWREPPRPPARLDWARDNPGGTRTMLHVWPESPQQAILQVPCKFSIVLSSRSAFGVRVTFSLRFIFGLYLCREAGTWLITCDGKFKKKNCIKLWGQLDELCWKITPKLWAIFTKKDERSVTAFKLMRNSWWRRGLSGKFLYWY